MAYRVFLSSTSKDLAAYREAVHRAIDALDGFALIKMESFGARDTDARGIDEQKLRAADLLVGLMGHCYGSSPRDHPTSFTEQEYDLAAGREPPLPRLMFVAPDHFPVPHHLIEPDDKRARQKAFRERVMADRVVASFNSPQELATGVATALANWRVERITAELVAAREEAAKYREEAARRAELERSLAEGQEERKALRAAVQALADKAQAPEAPPEVEQALALLPEGRTAEARAVFEEIVARKETEGAAALKEAAEAARHLGALAYLESTEQAIAAYARATRLDPDDAWSWIFLGRLQVQAGSLTAAEQAFEQAGGAATRTGSKRDESIAQAYLGDVRLAQGNLPDALKAYEGALSVHHRLADRDPTHLGRQRDLSLSFDRIGDVLVAQGNLGPALDSYRAALAIRERLAQADPGNAGWQRDLSVSHNKIGDVLVAQGNLGPALDSYRAALVIAERLAQADPGNAGWQRDLSVSHDRIGDVLVAQGNLGPALDSYRASLAIRERLAQADPGNAGWQRDLWVSLWKLAQVEGTGVTWAQVLEKMEAMKARGVLLQTDEPFLEQARTLAAGK
jgi:tetratricopeptide (TPR) repeat protein